MGQGTRFRYSPEERAARLEAAGDRLTQAVAAIVTDDDWRRYLDWSRRLHRYSARNVALLMQQAYERDWDELGHVAGYRTWQQLGRQVRRGERGLVVLAPCAYKVTDEATGEERTEVRGFRLETVFAARQTDGEGEIPAPVRPQLLEGDGPAGAWEALAALVEARGYRLSREGLYPANGRTSWDRRSVVVSDRLEPAAAVKTLAHELAHVLLHEGHVSDERTECEAESVAYLVCSELGLETDAYSFAYVARWADGQVATVTAALDRATKCARAILDELAGAPAVETSEPAAA